MNIEEVFIELGYKLVNHGNYYTTSALYRGGTSPTSLTIYPKKNLIIDWVTGQKFNLDEIVKTSLQLSNLNQAKEWLDRKEVKVNTEKPEPALNEPKIFPIEWVENLKPDHSYWIGRGISERVLKEFKGGIADIPRMKGRYVLGIWNSKNQLIGLQGRSLNGKMPKYKILGEKSKFCYPLHLNIKNIKQKSEIILVEGVGCMFSLMEADIKNSMVLFGINLSNHQLSTILAINPKKIIVGINNDNAGQENADKLQRRLWKFFDKKQIEIKLPALKDLNEILVVGGIKSIKGWYEK